MLEISRTSIGMMLSAYWWGEKSDLIGLSYFKNSKLFKPRCYNFRVTTNGVVWDLIIEALNVAQSNLYKQFDNNITLKHINNIIKMLKMNHIELPDINKVNFSKISENERFGDLFKCKIMFEYNEEDMTIDFVYVEECS